MPNNLPKNKALQTRTNALEDQPVPAPKFAIATAKSQQNSGHLTSEIVNEIIDERIGQFVDLETAQKLVAEGTNTFTEPRAVHKLITARISPLIERATVHRLFSERLEQLVDRETVHKIITERQSFLPRSLSVPHHGKTTSQPTRWTKNRLKYSPRRVRAKSTFLSKRPLLTATVRRSTKSTSLNWLPTTISQFQSRNDREGYFPGL